MEGERTRNRPTRDGSPTESPLEPEGGSSLLREARGWAGSARDALARMDTDQAMHLLQTRRRNGPGQ